MTVQRSIRPLFAALMAAALLAGGLALAPVAGADVPAGDATLSGVATDHFGAPIETFVQLCQPQSGFCLLPAVSSTTSAADGSFAFVGIAPGEYRLTTSVPIGLDGGYQLPGSTVVTLAPSSTTTRNIALGLGGKVSGQVRLPNGTPVLSSVSITNEPANIFSGSDAAQSDPITGQYLSWRAVPGPTATVRANPGLPGYFGATVTGVPITPGATTPGVDLVLDPGGTVHGTVRGPVGEPVPGASVSLGSTPAGCNPCTPSVLTAADGTFSQAAPSGAVYLSVTPPAGTSYVSAPNTITSVPTGGIATVSVTLQKASTVVGTITALNGTLTSTNALLACTAPNVLNTASASPSAPCMRPDQTPAPSAGQFGSNATPGTFQINAVPAPARYNVYSVTVTNFGVPLTFVASPAAEVDIAPGDVVSCQFEIDMDTSGPDLGSAFCSGGTGIPPGGSNAATVPSTGGGTTTIASPAGTTLASATSVDPTTLGGGLLPPGVSLPYGAYSFSISGVTPGGTADVTLTYPAVNPTPNGYAKFIGGIWQDASALVVPGSATAGSITIRLTDGGPFDTDPAAGVIGDPGGPALVDKTAPSVSLSGPADGATYTLGAVPAAGCTATDEPGGSGVASPACTVSVTGGNANGVGTFTASATATDLAGNSASVTRTYRVVYAVDALRVPFSKVLTTSPVAGGGVAGVPFPVSVTARRADGSVVTPVSARWVEPVKAGSVLKPLVTTGLPAPVTTASSFTGATDGSMGFLWRTTRSQTLSYWRIGVTLDDGTTHTVIVALL